MMTEDYAAEVNEIIRIGIMNGYAPKTVRRIIKRHERKKQLRNLTTLTAPEEEKIYRSLTYCGKVFEVLGKASAKRNVHIVANSGVFKTKRLLKSSKDAVPDIHKSGVYKLTCEDRNCTRTYIGQSRRRISIRQKEHFALVRKNERGKSAFSDHMLETGHLANQSSIQLMREVEKAEKLDIFETIEIRKELRRNPDLLNNDNGPVDSVYTRLF